MELFADLDRIIQGYLPADKIELIKRAFVIARDAHEGQFRSSGEPYITHPVAVASIIAEMHLDMKQSWLRCCMMLSKIPLIPNPN